MAETPQPASGEPAWDVARLFPDQGTWSEEEYLALNGNRLVEFSHGAIEVLVMPTEAHQGIVAFLFSLLSSFVQPRDLGRIRFAPLRLRLWEGKFREPDLLFLSAARLELARNDYWRGADLVVEVVSDDDRRRDLDTKRREYARAGIPEYWIVDPREGEILVLSLEAGAYREAGRYGAGTQAASVVLPGFVADVGAVFAAAHR